MTDIKDEPYSRAAEYKRALWGRKGFAPLKEAYMEAGWQDVGPDHVAKFGMLFDLLFNARRRMLEIHIKGDLPGTVTHIDKVFAAEEDNPRKWIRDPLSDPSVVRKVLTRLYGSQYRRFGANMWAVMPRVVAGPCWLIHCQKIEVRISSRTIETPGGGWEWEYDPARVPSGLASHHNKHVSFILTTEQYAPWFNWVNQPVSFLRADQRVVQWPNPNAIKWSSPYDLREALFISHLIATSRNGRMDELEDYRSMKCAQRDFPKWLP